MTIPTEVKATGLELTPAIKSYVEEKLLQVEKLVDISTGGVRAEVEVGKTTDHHRHGDIFKAEFNLQVNGSQFRSEVTGADLYAALDEAKDELVRQITSQKDKNQTLFRRGARRLKNILRFGR
ncbi:MAG: ribosome-associated translation inhibitor RaiA [Candidatus Pacebacteria bacterium]|nr:ribosome-associated translation inhibitor RaiA [Candidatus Paceibacterota bacterium]